MYDIECHINLYTHGGRHEPEISSKNYYTALCLFNSVVFIIQLFYFIC
jgi:hypothetical protein